jgi:hypothetical protein
MTCSHLQQLYKLCQQNDLKLGSSDLIRVLCNQCGEQEVCPSTLTDEYEHRITQQEKAAALAADARSAAQPKAD